MLGSLSVAGCDDDGSSVSLPDGGGGQAGAKNDAAAGSGGAGGQDAAAGPDGAMGGTGVDASTGDAASSQDASAPLNALFAHIGGKLVAVNASTGALTEIGATGQDYIVLAWDDGAKVARVILDTYSPVGGAATPKLGTIDLCTGAVTPGPAIKVGNDQVRRAEGLARDPATGKFHVTFGRMGSGASTEYITESNGTIDVATGAVTVLGNHNTLQDDGDLLVFVGSTLYLLDVATGSNQGAVYTIDETNGAATKVVDTGPKLLRLAPDPTRNVVFVTYGEVNGTARGVATVNVGTGAMTKLGADLPNTSYPGANFTGLLSAPAPVCP